MTTDLQLYRPQTERGERYRIMGYWFAVGYEQHERDAKRDTDAYWFVPDHSQNFGNYAAWRADQYELNDATTSLSAIPDLYQQYLEAT